MNTLGAIVRQEAVPFRVMVADLMRAGWRPLLRQAWKSPKGTLFGTTETAWRRLQQLKGE